jgi:manganese/zinc/iron transport system permease protein
MGVVFTSLFALGLVMLVQAADKVDLDPDCVLYGAIELTPLDTIQLLGNQVPRAAAVLAVVAVINALFVTLFFKELKICSFDAGLADTMGFSSRLMHYLLMVLVSVTAVASFESVGSILVVAMFVVPAATAYMLTDRLWMMIVLSVLVGIASAVLGHIAALEVPTWFGYRSTTTAGMMAVVAGLLFMLAATLAPRHGVFVKWARRQLLSLRILSDDVLAILYRKEEASDSALATRSELMDRLFAGATAFKLATAWLQYRGQLETKANQYSLTEDGRDRARELIRSHRLWEQYLVEETDAGVDNIHHKAERFEHFTDRRLRDRLDSVTDAPQQDPHGKPIPVEKNGAKKNRPDKDRPDKN